MKKLFHKKHTSKVEPVPEGFLDITGIDKAELLAAFFNNIKPQNDFSASMTYEEATAIINKTGLSFTFLNGRRVYADLTGDSFNPGGYDLQNGTGAAQKVVKNLRCAQQEEFIPSAPRSGRFRRFFHAAEI